MTAARTISIRAADSSDCDLILSFIKALSVYEKLEHEVKATAATLRATLFGTTRCAEVVIAYLDGAPAGFALFFHNYSTFLAKPGLYLEDLFVDPAARGAGVGRALLVHLAKIATDRGCGRFEWSVLDWNTPAIKFYEALGARAMNDWTIFRVDGAALDALAARS